MAPETLNGSYDYRVDWWALGCIMFVMACGKTPFENKSSRNTMNNILNNKVIFPHANNVPLSDSFKDLILKLLDKNPAKRLTGKDEIFAHAWFAGFDPESIDGESED